MLAALDMKLNFRDELRRVDSFQVYTFGSPRVGNIPFGTFYDAHIPATFRVELEKDPVPLQPSWFGWFKHGGKRVVVDLSKHGIVSVDLCWIGRKLLYFSSTISLDAHSLEEYRSALEACLSEEEFQIVLDREFFHKTYNRKKSQDLESESDDEKKGSGNRSRAPSWLSAHQLRNGKKDDSNYWWETKKIEDSDEGENWLK